VPRSHRLPTLAALALAVLALAAGLLSGSGSGDAVAESATPTPTPAGQPITVTWGGDVTLGSSYGQPPDAGWPQLAPVSKLLLAADLATVNYEGTFGSGGSSKCTAHSSNCFAFQAPARNARTLARAGVDAVNHANNHAWDFGALGWHSTREALKAAKVTATGAPGELALMRRKGTRIALVGFSTYPWSASMASDVNVRALVGRAAAQADVVIAFMHAGAEGASKAHVPYGAEQAFGEYRGDSRHFAHTAIDAGADLVLGSGPHVLRGVELYKNRLVAYSLGNLTGWHNFNTGGNSALSGLLTVALAADGRFFAGRIDSLRLDRTGVPHADPSRAAARFISGLSRTDFPRSGLRIDRSGRVLAVKR
jgi:hypothetical protein